MRQGYFAVVQLSHYVRTDMSVNNRASVSASVPARKMTAQPQQASKDKRLSIQPQPSSLSKQQKRTQQQRPTPSEAPAAPPATSGCLTGMTEVWWSAKKFAENAALVKTAVGQAINTTVTNNTGINNLLNKLTPKPKPSTFFCGYFLTSSSLHKSFPQSQKVFCFPLGFFLIKKDAKVCA